MTSLDLDWFCEDCPRIEPQTRVAEFDTGRMGVSDDERFTREVTIVCSHRRVCSRMVRMLEKRMENE